MCLDRPIWSSQGKFRCVSVLVPVPRNVCMYVCMYVYMFVCMRTPDSSWRVCMRLYHTQKDLAQRWAESQGYEFFETSAKNSANVDTAFVWLVKEITKRRGLNAAGGASGAGGSAAVVKPQLASATDTEDKCCK